MKKTILGLLLLSTTSAFAFEVNLAEQEKMLVSELIEIGADSVQCSQIEARCILKGAKYGVQYVGEKIEDVALTEASGPNTALSYVKRLKREGICK